MSRVFGVKNFRVTLQTGWAPELFRVRYKAGGLLANSKLKIKTLPHTQCVFPPLFHFYLFILLSICEACLQPAFSSEHMQPPERQPLWIKANNLTRAHDSAFRSISQGRLEKSTFLLLLFLFPSGSRHNPPAYQRSTACENLEGLLGNTGAKMEGWVSARGLTVCSKTC